MFNFDASKQKERRFNDEQIRTLEAVFESETKLEPGKKMKLAQQLGLQPRQIAIWFQNKRARWKSKTIEKDFTLLLADYGNLSSQFEALKKEQQSLLFQLQKLKNETVTQIQETATKNTSVEFLVNNIPSKYMEGIVSDDRISSVEKLVGSLGFLEEEEAYQCLNSAMSEVLEVSSASTLEDFCGLQSDDMMNQGAESSDPWWFLS